MLRESPPSDVGTWAVAVVPTGVTKSIVKCVPSYAQVSDAGPNLVLCVKDELRRVVIAAGATLTMMSFQPPVTPLTLPSRPPTDAMSHASKPPYLRRQDAAWLAE